jgi:peptide chain release factor subunit 1
VNNSRRWSELPYIVPIVEHGIEHHTYLVVAVDRAGADITGHQGNSVHSETAEGGGYPVHHAHSADTPGYGDPQRTVEGAVEHNTRARRISLAT